MVTVVDLSVTVVTLVTKVSNVSQLCYYCYHGYPTTRSRIIFLVFATWTDFNKDFSIHIIVQSGTNAEPSCTGELIFLMARIFQNFLNFWKICGPLLLSSLTKDT